MIEKDDQALIDVNSPMIFISLNEGPEKTGDAETKNQKHQNSKTYLKGQD
jgi:hypothetical protein